MCALPNKSVPILQSNNKNRSSLPWSHKVPCQLPTHVHVAVFPLAVHVALFLHGLGEHGVGIAEIHRTRLSLGSLSLWTRLEKKIHETECVYAKVLYIIGSDGFPKVMSLASGPLIWPWLCGLWWLWPWPWSMALRWMCIKMLSSFKDQAEIFARKITPVRLFPYNYINQHIKFWDYGRNISPTESILEIIVPVWRPLNIQVDQRKQTENKTI